MKADKKILGLVCLVWGVFLCNPLCVKAEIATDNAFENAAWKKVIEEDRQGVVQSVCVTDQYIVSLENISDSAKDNDVIRAYYKDNKDKNGNDVEQYSLAKEVNDRCYEHANGMAYNPNTQEIAVALYTNAIAENRGCIYIIDADSLEYKDKVKISDDYNILGIGYDEGKDQYVIQTNVDGGYSFKILDHNFQIVEELGEYADTAIGDNFQDLCVSEDYIINFPLTWGMGIGDYINMYSISKKEMVSSSLLDFQFENVIADEPESICEIEPGLFLAAVNVDYSDGRKTVCYYETMVPYNFPVSKEKKNVKVKETKEITDTIDTTDTTDTETNVEINRVQKEQKSGSKLLLLISLIGAAGIIVIWRRIVYVRRERRKKAIRTRRERERMRQEYQL